MTKTIQNRIKSLFTWKVVLEIDRSITPLRIHHCTGHCLTVILAKLTPCILLPSRLSVPMLGSVTLSTSFISVNCASMSAFISDPVFKVLFYIQEGYSPLGSCLSLAAATFSLYLAFIEISCVWLNVVDIKPNLCPYNKSYSSSNRYIMVSEGFGSLWDPRRTGKVFLSVSYDIKYQKVARKHMATSRDKEYSRAGSSADTHIQQLAAATTQHSNFQKHTRSSISTKTKSCHNKELSKHIHSVLL